MEVVEKNRSIHEKQYKDAMDGWQRKRAKVLNELANKAEKGVEDLDMNVLWRLEKPTHHLKDYDRLLSMLKQHVKDEVELSNDDFGKYFEDDWAWKDKFATITSSYISK